LHGGGIRVAQGVEEHRLGLRKGRQAAPRCAQRRAVGRREAVAGALPASAAGLDDEGRESQSEATMVVAARTGRDLHARVADKGWVGRAGREHPERQGG
jgi:hypothetical protein